jgi:hypothetical protein
MGMFGDRWCLEYQKPSLTPSSVRYIFYIYCSSVNVSACLFNGVSSSWPVSPYMTSNDDIFVNDVILKVVIHVNVLFYPMS